MIATRFRSVGWVAVGSTAMLACYLVTQTVAGERAQLAKVEHRLLVAKRDVRRLQTEIETRARMAQIERWNRDGLALTAPRPSQYVRGEVELASFVKPPEPVAPAASAPADVAQASYAPAAGAGGAQLVPATYIRPKDDAVAPGPQRIAMVDGELAVAGPVARQGKTGAQ